MINFDYKIDNFRTLKLIEIKNGDECWFQCLHTYSIFYKTPKQIISNQFIIDRLASPDSCLVGIICGEAYRFYINNQTSIRYILNKEAKHNVGRCKILSVYRNKIIEYENEENKIIKKSILELSKNIGLISKFSSRDSYYIGFLTGLELYKLKNFSSQKMVKNKLKLIHSYHRIARNFCIR